jgi:hypothetical protein
LTLRYLGFGRCAVGIAAVVTMLAGCGGSREQNGGTGAVQGLLEIHLQVARARTAPQYVYISNQVHSGSGWASTVNIYSAFLNGNISPSSVIGGSQTQLTAVNGIAVDSAGEIYVVNSDTDEIVGFAPGSSGDVSPNVVIAGANTDLSAPVGLAIDSSGNLYVANCACGGSGSSPAILEFSAGSNGDVAPIRDISGSQTQLSNPNEPYLDASGQIYVSNYMSNSIDVFAATANGNVSPLRVVSGSNTLLNSPDGIAVDRYGLYAGSAAGHYVERFRPRANGNVPPVAAISGGRTRLENVNGLFLDPKGVIYAASASNRAVLKFSPLANGDVRPIGKIEGPNTELADPCFIFLK